jgi:hypothetical protein
MEGEEDDLEDHRQSAAVERLRQEPLRQVRTVNIYEQALCSTHA